LKYAILADLDRYLPRDPLLPLALKRLALGGRRLLLITNSEWFYTDALGKHLFDGAIPGLGHWRELFDLVIVEAGKPTSGRLRSSPTASSRGISRRGPRACRRAAELSISSTGSGSV
jgi:5' nucleotidase family